MFRLRHHFLQEIESRCEHRSACFVARRLVSAHANPCILHVVSISVFVRVPVPRFFCGYGALGGEFFLSKLPGLVTLAFLASRRNSSHESCEYDLVKCGIVAIAVSCPLAIHVMETER